MANEILHIRFLGTEQEANYLREKLHESIIKIVVDYFETIKGKTTANYIGFKWEIDSPTNMYRKITVSKASPDNDGLFITVAEIFLKNTHSVPDLYRSLLSDQVSRFQKIAGTLYESDCLSLVKFFGNRAPAVWNWIQDQFEGEDPKPVFYSEIYVRLKRNQAIMDYVMSGVKLVERFPSYSTSKDSANNFESARGVLNDEQTRIYGGAIDPWEEAMEGWSS